MTCEMALNKDATIALCFESFFGTIFQECNFCVFYVNYKKSWSECSTWSEYEREKGCLFCYPSANFFDYS